MSPSGFRQDRAGRQFADRPGRFLGPNAKALLAASSRDCQENSIAQSTTLSFHASPVNRGGAVVCLLKKFALPPLTSLPLTQSSAAGIRACHAVL